MKRSGPLGTLLRYELIQVLRDRRTILIAVVAPLLVYPLLIVLARWAEDTRERALQAAVYDYAVTGPAADWGRRVARQAADLPPEEDRGAQRLQERAVAHPDSVLQAGGIDLVVEALEPDSLGVPLLLLRYRTNSDFSRAAYEAMDRRLRRLREREREDLFARRGFPASLSEVGELETRNLATAREEGGARLAMILTPLLVLLMLGGGAVVAADAISGEKERGTLETLLTTAATRRQVVGAKLLSIVVLGLAVTAVNVLNLLAYVVLGVVEVPPRFAVDLPPEALVLLLLLYAPVALLVGALLLLLSGYAKSYKEYQIYAIPSTLLILVPSLAAALPGIELRSVIAAVPLAGISVAVREVLTGEYDWPFLALAFASTAAAAGAAARGTAAFLSRERLITASELDAADLTGGEALFRRHVLRWFGVLWVLVLLTSQLFLGEYGIRAQVTWNLVVLFLGGSILMIGRYDLDPARALALRRPPAPAWLAVAVGAPSALLTGVGVSRVAEIFFPVPERMMEAFGQFLLPEGMPVWQILFFLCLLPGVTEEIAFRGVLLHGLRRKLGPVRLALAVGLIFGLFHMTLFRIVPTAYMGAVLTAVVLLTGSIYPAMAWHALNNGFALLSARLGFPLDEAPLSLVAVGVAGLAVAAWILWRSRSPYPDLRTGGSREEGGGATRGPTACTGTGDR